MKSSELFLLLNDLSINFEKTIPIISDLKNPAMRERHWQQLKESITNMTFLSPSNADFNFELLSRPELIANDQKIKDISKKADHEKDIEDGIESIRLRWQGIQLNLEKADPKSDKSDMRITKISKTQELEEVFNRHTEQLAT